ncbi:MAG: outer membrane beta-barrel protein [Akkermansia sp.]|nr:outer membrane beta-barrel protein [Akkermansia sp.]
MRLNILLFALGCAVLGSNISFGAISTGTSVEFVNALTNKTIDEVDVPNTFGVRLSGSVYVPATESVTHEFSMSAAPQWGTKTTSISYYGGGNAIYGSDKIDMFNVPLMAGYKMHYHLSEKLVANIGGRVGYTIIDADDSYSGRVNGTYVSGKEDAGIDGGFTFAVGAGMSYQYAENCYYTFGYEFQDTSISFDDPETSDTHIGQHVISAGINVRF